MHRSKNELEWDRGRESYSEWNKRIAPHNVRAAFEAAIQTGTGWLLLNDYEKPELERYRWRPDNNLFKYKGHSFELGYDRNAPYLHKIS